MLSSSTRLTLLNVAAASCFALAGCYQALDCGSLLVERDGSCMCPAGTTFVADPPSCRLVDGGVVVVGDGGAVDAGMTPDAQADDAATPDGGVAVRVTAISAGADHTCALLSNRTALCWGANDLGQLGDGTRIPRSLPTPVLSADGMSVLDEVDSIAAGAGHTCAVRAGVVWCWGRNDWGQLGNGEEDTDSATPVRVLAFDRVAILAGAIAVRAGDNNTCALMTDTTVQCWGLHIGRCSVSGDCNNDVAGPVSLLGDVRSLEVGTEVGCVATGGGAAWCWGDNAHSAVGDGLSTSYAFRPESVRAARVVGEPMGTAILVDALAVAVGSRHACAARTGRPAVCWGDNRSLQLGFSGRSDESTPVPVRGIGGAGYVMDANAIAAGDRHSCAVRADGRVLCWGANDMGQLGRDDGVGPFETAHLVQSSDGTGVLQEATSISAGRDHTCVVTTLGEAMCWGSNATGQLGDGTTESSSEPVLVAWDR